MYKYLFQKTKKMSILLLGALLLSSTYVFSQDPIVLYGYKLSNNGMDNHGFISFTSQNPGDVTLINDYKPTRPVGLDQEYRYFLSAGECVDGVFYGYIWDDDWSNETFVKISTDTWTVSSIDGVWVYIKDMAYDYKNEVMYGIGRAKPNLYTINLEDGSRDDDGLPLFDATTHGVVTPHTLACDAEGNLYIIDAGSNLRRVNKETGETTQISYIAINLSADYEKTMAFDHNTGKLFCAAYYEEACRLYEIDPVSGQASPQGDIEAGDVQIIGLYSFKTEHNIDAKLSQIKGPETGKGLSKSEEIRVTVKNVGRTELTNFDINLNINGVISTKNFTGSILCGRQEEFTFPVDLSAVTTYNITATLQLPNDENPSDNSKSITFTNFSDAPLVLNGYKVRNNGEESYGFVYFSSENSEIVETVNDYTPENPIFTLAAGEHVNGVFYGYLAEFGGWNTAPFVKIKTDDWTVTQINTDDNVLPRDMAFDYTTGTMYGIRMNAALREFLTIDTITGAILATRSLDRNAYVLACSPEGNLFIIDNDGNFCSLKLTEAETIETKVIKSLGWQPSENLTGVQTMSFDPNTGRLFWAMFKNDESRLIEINPETGDAIDRGVIAENAEIIGLYTFITEYEVDGVLSQIIAPQTGKGLSNSEEIKVIVKNNGSKPLSNFNVVLDVNGSTIIKNFNETIESGKQAEVSFTVDMSEIIVYYITATLDIENDEVPANNSRSITVTNFSAKPEDLFGYKLDGGPTSGFVSFTSEKPAEVTPIKTYRPADTNHYLCAGEKVEEIFYGYIFNPSYGDQTFLIFAADWTTNAKIGSFYVKDMAYDHKNGKMYGIGRNDNASVLYTINLDDGNRTEVCILDNTPYTLACDSEGNLLIIDINGDLRKVVNKENGATEKIGNTGFIPDRNIEQTMTFAQNSGRLYWALNNNQESRLIEINPTSGQAIDRGMIVDQAKIFGLYLLSNLSVHLTTNNDLYGTVTGEGTYPRESSVTVEAIPNPGYGFVNWTNQKGNIVSTSAKYIFDINESVFLTANFAKLYEVKVSSSHDDYGSVEGAGTFIEGTEVTVKATEKDGYVFIHWADEAGIVSKNPEYKFELTRNIELTAYFIAEGDAGRITLSANPGIGGTVIGEGTFEKGKEVTVEAKASDGYVLFNWTVNGIIVSKDPTYLFTLNGDIELIANFVRTEDICIITLTANPTEGGTVTGEETFIKGTEVTVEAIPSSGYDFVSWSDDEDNILSTAKDYTFTIAGNISLTANFAKLFEVQVFSNDDDFGTVEGARIATEGTLVTVKATAKDGYEFLYWTDESDQKVSHDAEYAFNLIRNIELTAKFESKANVRTVTLHVNPEESGKVTGGGNYSDGENVTVQAIPNIGFDFINWTDDEDNEVSDQLTHTFTLTEDVELTANFSKKVYTITVSVNPANSGTVTGGETDIPHGTTVTVKANANPGYKFDNWTVDGVEKSNSSEYTFTVIEHVDLVANFSMINYTVTVSPTSIKLGIGKETTLETSISPVGVPDEVIIWSSDKPEIAEVDAATGKVTAKSVGTAIITATMQFGGATASCEVTVYQQVTSVEVSPTALTLEVGDTQELTVTVLPVGAEDKSVKWDTNSPGVATVSATGVVTAVGEGSATITATTNDGGLKSPPCTVTVTKKTGFETPDQPLANLYPNPTKGLFILSFETPGTYHVTITTMSGTILQRQIINAQTNAIDISNYPTGVYLVLIDNGKQQSTIRLVKAE